MPETIRQLPRPRLHRRFLAWLHHRRMLFQYDLSGQGTFAVLRSGKLLSVLYPPRHGSCIWELEDGISVDSSEISTIDDQSGYGYQVREKDYGTWKEPPANLIVMPPRPRRTRHTYL